jgi:hypothetical protein
MRSPYLQAGLFGRTKFGVASISVGEVVAGQVRLLLALGVNVHSGNLGTPGSIPESGASQLALWDAPGVSPTLQRFKLELHGASSGIPAARIVIDSEFVFDRTGGRIGPKSMRLIHRAAAGGLAKLTRYLCVRARSAEPRRRRGDDDEAADDDARGDAFRSDRYGDPSSRAGTELTLLPSDFCALGATEQHVRTMQVRLQLCETLKTLSCTFFLA